MVVTASRAGHGRLDYRRAGVVRTTEYSAGIGQMAGLSWRWRRARVRRYGRGGQRRWWRRDRGTVPIIWILKMVRFCSYTASVQWLDPAGGRFKILRVQRR